jgi:hypothetical protein
MSDYPIVLYHTSIERPRNVFGRIIDGAEPVHKGDLQNPGYPIPLANAADLHTKGTALGGLHLIPKYHYKTMSCAVYDIGGILDEEASRKREAELVEEGWVRNPNDLKEDYDEADN